VERREFLGRLGVAAVGLTCFKDWGTLRAAVAQARREGKPLLSQGAINQLIHEHKDKGPKASHDFAEQAKADVKGVLKTYFTLTPDQEAEVASLSEADMATLKGAIERGMDPNNHWEVVIVPRDKVHPDHSNGPNPGEPSELPVMMIGITTTTTKTCAADGSSCSSVEKTTVHK
jgi:hypothetical protein